MSLRKKDEILKKISKNLQKGAYGGIPPDILNYAFLEVLLDIRDILSSHQGKGLLDQILDKGMT